MGKASDRISSNEGFRARPYKCTEDKWTWGIGFNIEAIEMPREVADFWLGLIIDEIRIKLHEKSWYSGLDENRRVVIEDMVYQMGLTGVCDFKNMIKALEWRNWSEAAKHLLDSRYAVQTPERANRNADTLRTGIL